MTGQTELVHARRTAAKALMGLALTSPDGRCIRHALFKGGRSKMPCRSPLSAQVVELVDALASGASDRKVVKVRVLSWAPLLS